MHFEYRRGDVIHVVTLDARGDGGWSATLSQRPASASRGDETDQHELELTVDPVGAGVYSVLIGHEVHEARVAREGTEIAISLESGDVVLHQLDPLGMEGLGADVVAGGPASVASPIPGRVVKIPVEIGDDVEEGQAVIVVEAMKMANELSSPVAGRVTSIKVATGDTVEAGQPLVVVEPPDAEE